MDTFFFFFFFALHLISDLKIALILGEFAEKVRTRKISVHGGHKKLEGTLVNPICIGGMGQLCPPLSYSNKAPKRKQSYSLIYPDLESNLITHNFRKFGVSRTTGTDVIFAFVRAPKEFQSVLSTMHAY